MDKEVIACYERKIQLLVFEIEHLKEGIESYKAYIKKLENLKK